MQPNRSFRSELTAMIENDAPTAAYYQNSKLRWKKQMMTGYGQSVIPASLWQNSRNIASKNFSLRRNSIHRRRNNAGVWRPSWIDASVISNIVMGSVMIIFFRQVNQIEMHKYSHNSWSMRKNRVKSNKNNNKSTRSFSLSFPSFFVTLSNRDTWKMFSASSRLLTAFGCERKRPVFASS